MPATKQAPASSADLEQKQAEIHKQLEQLRQELTDSVQAEAGAILSGDDTEALIVRTKTLEGQISAAERLLKVLVIAAENAKHDEEEERKLAEKKRLCALRSRYRQAVESLTLHASMARDAQLACDEIYREFAPFWPKVPDRFCANDVLGYGEYPFRMWRERVEKACARL